jgi:hypothetical protein
VQDVDRRIAGTAVNWSLEWDDAFADALLDRIVAYLTASDAPKLSRT